MQTVNVRFGGLVYPIVLDDHLLQLLKGKVFFPDDVPFKGIVEKEHLSTDDDAVTLEWITKDAPGLLTHHLLMPTLRLWGAAIDNGSFETIFPWKRFARAFKTLAQEIDDLCLRWGEINRMPVTESQLRAVARFMFLQSGGASVGMLRSLQAGENESQSWIFAPYQNAHLSSFAQMSYLERAALGEMKMVWGEWRFFPLSQQLRGKAAERAVEHGIPCVIEQQGKFLVRTGWIKGGKVSAPFAAGEIGEKAIKRLKLGMANSARPHDVHFSPLTIQGVPVTSGALLKNVFVFKGEGGAIGGPGDGGFLVRPGFHIPVVERRTQVCQLASNVDVKVRAGTLIHKGESLLGIPDLLPAEFDCVIQQVSASDDGGVQSVKVAYEIRVDSQSPKIRGMGIKASAHTDLFGVIPEGIDAILDAKSAEIVCRQAFLLDVKRRYDLTPDQPDFDAESMKAYESWRSAHTMTIILRWPVTEQAGLIMRAVGLQVDDGFATRQITGVLCPAIIGEIESPVTDLRLTRTSLTMLTALELEEVLGGEFQPVKTAVYACPIKVLTTADTLDAIKLTFKDGLNLLADRYPEGFLIRNGHADDGVEDVSVAVDPKAVLTFSSGKLRADDAMGLLLWQSLHEKATYAAVASGTDGPTEKAQARQRLGSVLSGLRMAINNLAVSRSILRRLVTGKRSVAMVTVRTYDYVPVHDVWLSQNTAEQLGFKDGQYVIIGRHPTALFFKASVKIVPGLPDTVAAISSLSMNVTNKGDADGDQVWIAHAGKAAALYSSAVKSRDITSRLICMLAWNSGLEVTSTPSGSYSPYKARGASMTTLWKRSMRNYTRHTEITHTQYAKTVSPKDTSPKTKSLDCYIDPKVYEPMAVFGSIGIGMAFGIVHNARVLAEYADPEDRWAFRQAFLIGQDIYEDVFLAGYTPDRALVLDALQKAVPYSALGETIAELRDALAKNGIKVDDDEVLKAIIISRNMNGAFSDTPDRITWVGKHYRLVPVCKALRGLSSGRKRLIVSPEEWQSVIELTADDNPFREIIGSIGDVYRLLATVVASREEPEF